MNIDKKQFWLAFAAGLALYAVSFAAWANPVLNYIIFASAIVGIAYILWRDFSWSIPLLIFDSILGSQGRLLSIEIYNFSFSLRYLLFALVIIFAIPYLIKHWKKFTLRQDPNSKFQILNSINFFWTLGLLFIVWGIFRAVIAGASFQNIFFDSNAYGFWLLWPIFYLFYANNNKAKTNGFIFTIAIAAIFAQTVATYLLFITQIAPAIQPLFYVWARDVRLAEMTKIGEYGVRIFWQSHLWAVMSLGLAGILLWLKKINYYYLASLFLGLVMFSAILSFSRSFLLSLLVALIITLILSHIIYLTKFHWRQLAQTTLIAFFICVLLLMGTMYIARQHIFSFDDLGQGRLENISSDEASASRLAEFKPLWSQIIAAPILGSGFGQKLTYQSFDPRQNKKPYTTFSFEWGYLDMWMKMGLGFLIALGGFIIATYRKFYQMYMWGDLPDFGFLMLSFALTFLLITHLTTPYLNHPIGLVLLFWIANYKPKS